MTSSLRGAAAALPAGRTACPRGWAAWAGCQIWIEGISPPFFFNLSAGALGTSRSHLPHGGECPPGETVRNLNGPPAEPQTVFFRAPHCPAGSRGVGRDNGECWERSRPPWAAG